MRIRAALFDFGGVLTTSPFDSFRRYERANGLPDGFLRQLNATNADANAWARHERNEISVEEFCAAYEAEARVAGYEIDARAVLACLATELRPEMIEAVRRCRERIATALLTNNMRPMGDGPGSPTSERWTALNDSLFDVVIESSKIGVRKPDVAFYRRALDRLAVEPAEAVFLDDLGVNLKPARQMGMVTIKVTDPDVAIAELEDVVGFPLRA